MLRRSVPLLALNIPRSTWDPAHHNPNWTDSYAADIAARRHWPAKKWSIALEPRTPRDWLRFSYRNLAYAYNGALRACSTFPEMIVYYNEMKQRGVKVDVDTLNVLLTRAARYEQMQTDDIFLLFDELTSLGARPDLAAVETLHTVLEHSAQMPFEWREARRRQLIELYNYLAVEEIARLGSHHVDALLASQLQRIRKNLQQLRASISPSVYRQYFPVIDSGELLLSELHNFLWEFVSPDHPAMEVPALQLRIPHVGTVMKRPPLTSNDAKTLKSTDFEDTDVCSVFLAAVQRCIDGEFHDPRPISDRRMYLSLLTMLTFSGVLYSSDLISQLMDMIKYSPSDAHRDKDAQRLLRYALRGSSAAHDEEYRKLWRRVEKVVDARTVGRYLASRSPWSTLRICYDDKFSFMSYPPPQLASTNLNEGQKEVKNKVTSENSEAADKGRPDGENLEGVSGEMISIDMEDEPADNRNKTNADDGTNNGQKLELRTVEGLRLRWDDVKLLIKKTEALTDPRNAAHAMEVFTGQVVFLRTAVTGQRYGSHQAAMSTHAVGEDVQAGSLSYAEGVHITVWAELFRYTQEVHAEMEKYLAEHPGTEPEFECWEGMLIILRSILDYAAHQVQQGSGSAAQELFNNAAELRTKLVEESLTRFNGRMRILWLQES